MTQWNYAEVWEAIAAIQPEQPAIEHGEQTTTWSAFDEHARGIADWLLSLGVALDGRGNVAADQVAYATSLQKVFACGDMRRGQSLVVWAIREGRQCAASIDQALMGATVLPR